jgi:5-hydroxyisourate hydrolase-like protein (transthyretin family)
MRVLSLLFPALLSWSGAVAADDTHLQLLQQSIALERIAATPAGQSRQRVPAAWQTQGRTVAPDADPLLVAKARRVAVLAAQLAKSPGGMPDAGAGPVPETLRPSGGAGGSCAAAIPLAEGRALRVAAGDGAVLWFRVHAGDAKALNVSTRGSTVDPALSVFDDCRVQDREPTIASDDNLGLQAEVTLLPRRQMFWFVRAEVLAGAGELVLASQRAIAITGRVTRQAGGAPLQGIRVIAYRVENGFPFYTSDTSTNANGEYALGFAGSGTYGIRTAEPMFGTLPSVIHEAYENHPCTDDFFSDLRSCGVQGPNFTFTPIVVVDPAERTIDFALQAGGVLTGTVTSSGGGPVVGAEVTLHNAFGSGIRLTTTDTLGRYRFEAMPTSAVLVTAASSDHARTLHAGIECPPQQSSAFCPWSSGTAVLVAPETQDRVDFTLRRQQFIDLSLTIGGVPPAPDVFLQFPQPTLLNSNGVAVGLSTYLGAGRYRLGPVVPGSYRLRVLSQVTYPQLYPDVRCSSDCIAELGLAPTITVSASDTSIPLSIDLRRYPRVEGRVSSEGSGEGVAGALVQLQRVSGFAATFNVNSNASGDYVIENVPPGSYLLQFISTTHGDEVHDNVPCESNQPGIDCPGATLVTIGTDAPDRRIDAALRRSGRIAGRISSNGSPLVNQFFILTLLSPDGAVRRTFNPSALGDGRFVAEDVPAGEWLVGASAGGSGFVPQLYPGVDCLSAQGGVWSGCPLALAARVTVGQGGLLDGIDFSLRGNGSLAVRVLNALDDQPLAGVAIDVWNANGQRVDTRATGADGRAYPVVSTSPAAPHALSTDNDQGLINEVFQDIPCPTGSVFFGSCALTGFTPVLLPAAQGTPEIVWRVARPIPIFSGNFEN